MCPSRLLSAQQAHLILIQSIRFLIKSEGEDLHDFVQINLPAPVQYQVTQTRDEAKHGRTFPLLSFVRTGVGLSASLKRLPNYPLFI